MIGYKNKIQAATLLFGCVCVLIVPISVSGTASPHLPGPGGFQPPIDFTPNVEELRLTSVAATAMATAAAPPDTLAQPTDGPPLAVVSGETITIGGKEYPLGDTFTDAEGIPMGVVEDSLFGDQGYSTIRAVGGEDYRLIWVTDRGEEQYMIVREDDPLFSGPDGFKETLEALGEAEERTFNAVKFELGGLGGIIAAEVAICPVTGTAGCIAAVVTAAGGLVGGFFLGMWRVFTDYIPARDNVGEAYEQIEINRP